MFFFRKRPRENEEWKEFKNLRVQERPNSPNIKINQIGRRSPRRSTLTPEPGALNLHPSSLILHPSNAPGIAPDFDSFSKRSAQEGPWDRETRMNPLPDVENSPAQASILVAAMCVAEVAGMLGVFAFPALLPYFLTHWDLSNSQAGWINGIYFVGYTAAVPLLTSLTDRVDARKIYLYSCALGALANLGFAFMATGFWTALLFRSISGFGLAGTFIPGLKALIDRLDSPAHPRAISF